MSRGICKGGPHYFQNTVLDVYTLLGSILLTFFEAEFELFSQIIRLLYFGVLSGFICTNTIRVFSFSFTIYSIITALISIVISFQKGTKPNIITITIVIVTESIN